MTESMIERIVEVLEKLPIRDNVERGGELDKLRLREAARAMILAMREPTEAMKGAGAFHDISSSYGSEENSFDFVSEDNAGEIFRTMIDAALIWPPGSADIAGVPMARD